MKKLIYAMLALAMTATTFVSCEDVPAPYDLPSADDSGNGGDDDDTPSTVEVIYKETMGTDASASDKPDVASYTGWAKEGTGASTVTYSGDKASVRSTGLSNASASPAGSGPNVIFFSTAPATFVVNNITLPSGQTKYQLTFNASSSVRDDDGNYTNTFDVTKFIVSLSDDGTKWTPITYTKNSGDSSTPYWIQATADFTLKTAASKLYIKFEANVSSAIRLDDVKLTTGNGGQELDLANGTASGDNTGGETTTDVASGDGSQANPYNYLAAKAAAEALAQGDNSTENYYIKGKVSEIKYTYSSQYGTATFYITDNGAVNDNQFCVYSAYYLGNKSYADGQTQIKVGDEVVVYGKLNNYNGTPETASKNAYLYSLNGKTTDSGSGDSGSTEEKTGAGSYAEPYNVTSALAVGTATGAYVKAYIVGCVNDKSISSASFDSSNLTATTNILVAASASETDVNNCLPVQLPKGDIRNSLNLSENAGNYKQEVLLYGNIEKYFGVTGIKSVTYAEINGNSYGTKP